MKPHLTAWWLTAGYRLLSVLLASLALAYGWTAWGPARWARRPRKPLTIGRIRISVGGRPLRRLDSDDRPHFGGEGADQTRRVAQLTGRIDVNWSGA